MPKQLIKVFKFLVLGIDSNSKTFARWQTREICRKLSPYRVYAERQQKAFTCKQTEKTDCTDFACWCYIRE